LDQLSWKPSTIGPLSTGTQLANSV